jgi:hypothetical protein
MDKWAMIFLMVLVVGMFSPVIVSEHGKKECRIEAIKTQMPADDIIKLCGK